VLKWARQNGCPDAARDALEHAVYEYDDESDEEMEHDEEVELDDEENENVGG